MRFIGFFAAAAIASLLICGCTSSKRAAPIFQAHWQPWTNNVTTVEQLASALESRWSLESIQAYCNATAPTPDSVQNLVALGEEWRGNLHTNEATGFDRVWWYASTRLGRLDKYSVNATKGHKHWIIEIGNQQSLTRPPILSGASK
jgi:hypothetical protein